jgi:hypothetical protein
MYNISNTIAAPCEIGSKLVFPAAVPKISSAGGRAHSFLTIGPGRKSGRHKKANERDHKHLRIGFSQYARKVLDRVSVPSPEKEADAKYQ